MKPRLANYSSPFIIIPLIGAALFLLSGCVITIAALCVTCGR